MEHTEMKLFQVHCGFYDTEICEGAYEGHVNYFVCAQTFEEARLKAKDLPEFKAKRMHVDGIQEIVAVDGCTVTVTPDPALEGKTVLLKNKQRELAPPPKQQPTL